MNQTPAPGDRIANYEIEQLLGRGGMATVFRVRHVDLGTRHAMKLPSMRSKSLTKRLLQEGRIQAQLRHPHVVGVSDVVHHGDDVGLVMDLVEGIDLQDLVARGPLSRAQVDSLAAALFDAVEAAHQLGLVHRDLKPANVLLEVSARGIAPRVTDFGLAKALSDGLRVARATRKGAMMGTPQYMAPEQFRDASSVDARADVYALGGVLYTMIAGRAPFPAGLDVVEQMKRVMAGAWTPLDELAPDAPTRWVEAVHACLSLDPGRRPRDIAALRRMWQPRPHAPGSVWPASLIAELRGEAAVPPSQRRTVMMGGDDSGTLHRSPLTDAAAPASLSRRPAAVWLVAAGGLTGLALVAAGVVASLAVVGASLWG
jgi:serine/threonine-protein kinase